MIEMKQILVIILCYTLCLFHSAVTYASSSELTGDLFKTPVAPTGGMSSLQLTGVGRSNNNSRANGVHGSNGGSHVGSGGDPLDYAQFSNSGVSGDVGEGQAPSKKKKKKVAKKPTPTKAVPKKVTPKKGDTKKGDTTKAVRVKKKVVPKKVTPQKPVPAKTVPNKGDTKKLPVTRTKPIVKEGAELSQAVEAVEQSVERAVEQSAEQSVEQSAERAMEGVEVSAHSSDSNIESKGQSVQAVEAVVPPFPKDVNEHNFEELFNNFNHYNARQKVKILSVLIFSNRHKKVPVYVQNQLVTIVLTDFNLNVKMFAIRALKGIKPTYDLFQERLSIVLHRLEHLNYLKKNFEVDYNKHFQNQLSGKGSQLFQIDVIQLLGEVVHFKGGMPDRVKERLRFLVDDDLASQLKEREESIDKEIESNVKQGISFFTSKLQRSSSVAYLQETIRQESAIALLFAENPSFDSTAIAWRRINYEAQHSYTLEENLLFLLKHDSTPESIKTGVVSILEKFWPYSAETKSAKTFFKKYKKASGNSGGGICRAIFRFFTREG